MALDDLKETIETLRERIQAHRSYLGQEIRTRQVLIDPMLRMLGWDIEHPDSVKLEYRIDRKRADYALMLNEKPTAVIEAKALGKPLHDEATNQVLTYANREGIPYMVVTDGDHWQMSAVFKQGRLEDRVLMEFQLTRDEPYACALQALGLWRSNLESGKPKEAVKPVMIKPPHDESVPPAPKSSSGQETVELSDDGDWELLTSLKVGRGQRPPAFIKFSNSSPKPIKNWGDLLESIAKHLVETDKLSARDCPVPVIQKRSKRYLVHTESLHPDSKQLERKRDIGKLRLNIDFTCPNAWENACWLLEKFGVNPSTVLVSTNRS